MCWAIWYVNVVLSLSICSHWYNHTCTYSAPHTNVCIYVYLHVDIWWKCTVCWVHCVHVHVCMFPLFNKSWLPQQMLLYLKEFSQRMVGRTHEIEKQVDTLVSEAQCTDTRVNNVYNDFLMLSNIQFVESVSNILCVISCILYSEWMYVYYQLLVQWVSSTCMYTSLLIDYDNVVCLCRECGRRVSHRQRKNWAQNRMR